MKTRTISAVVAVLLLVAIFWIWQLKGLYIICSLVALLGSFEFSRLAFSRFDGPMHVRFGYIFISLAVFALTASFDGLSALTAVAIGSVFFLTMVLMTIRSAEDIKIALQMQFAGVTGILYCGVLTGLTTRLLNFERGHVWLFSLLGVVFTGDTFAYLAGRTFGKTKLLEAVSPKKTVEGSIGGLIGSSLAGFVVGWFFLTQFPLWSIVLMALITGGFAQVGDLFESLIKRVAEVKDSGSIMPGHGGILDRIDGILFGAPVFYILARFLQST